MIKNSWWETNNAHGILIILSNILAGFLCLCKSDLSIYYSAIYICVGTWIYHFTVEHKNTDIEYLHHRIKQLERYAESLEKELEKAQNNSPQE